MTLLPPRLPKCLLRQWKIVRENGTRRCLADVRCHDRDGQVEKKKGGWKNPKLTSPRGLSPRTHFRVSGNYCSAVVVRLAIYERKFRKQLRSHSAVDVQTFSRWLSRGEAGSACFRHGRPSPRDSYPLAI